ncbi:MAG TPA: ribosomal RNA small subunit methyltransferase A [Desulfobulbus sp.]|nr:ribosomal RNA small subunit methyltransferase A [Desulfobulbus sp.]
MAVNSTKNILRRQKLAPNKKLGQNFLVHNHTAERIVQLADIGKNDIVTEVGVGLGALTKPLAKAARKVIGLEADSGIIRMHREQNDLPENVDLRHEDILQTDFKQLAKESGGRITFVANLPYSISTPFLFRLIARSHLIQSAVIMLQKEVALRLMAGPGTREYGVPTVLLAGCADIKMLMQVKPEEFHPRPKVDSAVVRLRFFPVPKRVERLDKFCANTLRKVVNAAFGQRRKTLLNALAGGNFHRTKEQLKTILLSCDISPSIRAERLEIQDFIRLANALEEHTHTID